MLISKKFVFIHMEKTGGMFVRSILFQFQRNTTPHYLRWVRDFSLLWAGKVHNKYIKYANLKLANTVCSHLPLSQGHYHGTCNQIPERHRHKRVLSIVRDPIDYYPSCYVTGCIGFNNKNASMSAWNWLSVYQECMKQDQNLPEFEEFFHFCNSVLLKKIAFERLGVQIGSSMGFLTFAHIYFFFKNPAEILIKTDAALETYFQSGEYKKNMYSVHFLNTKNLRQDLCDFLTESGFDRKHTDFILNSPKANYRKGSLDSSSFWDEQLTNQVKEKERIYYRYFYPPSNGA